MIAKWKIKALVQKGISFLPQKERINFWFQKNVTNGAHLSDQYFTYKIEHARDHIRFFEKFANQEFKESKVLELGTGWYPIVPIALFLNDLKTIHSIDLMDWLTAENVQTTCQKFVEWRKAGRLNDYLPYINEDKWEVISSLASDKQANLKDICKLIKLERWLGDARTTPFSDNSIDFICSNNTFEHIHKEILEGILKEFNRIVKPKGIMSHFIDMSDHFAHADSSINVYNFLRYSEVKWQRIDNDIQPQNRMRFLDYKKIYKAKGIPITQEEIRPGNEEELKSIPLAAKYKKYSVAELAISHGYLVSKMNKIE